MIYEAVRGYFTKEGESNPSAWRKLGAGAISGGIAQTCTYPLYANLEENQSTALMLILSVVTSFAVVSRSIPCPAWVTSTNQYSTLSELSSPKKALRVYTKASTPTY